MENSLTYFIIIFGLFMYVMAEISFKKQKKAMELDIEKHNRKVMLGLQGAKWDTDIETDCFHDTDFFLLENNGTCDTSYLANCEYHSFIDKDDLFLED